MPRCAKRKYKVRAGPTVLFFPPTEGREEGFNPIAGLIPHTIYLAPEEGAIYFVDTRLLYIRQHTSNGRAWAIFRPVSDFWDGCSGDRSLPQLEAEVDWEHGEASWMRESQPSPAR